MTSLPRISVVTSEVSPMAMILRRGPKNRTAALSWNRDTGDVVLGQWLKGTIYAEQADVSPDGKYFLYGASQGRKKWHCWTAISKVPYLHAVVWVGQDWPRETGGEFISDTHFQLYSGHNADAGTTGLVHENGGEIWRDMARLRKQHMERRGWRVVNAGKQHMMRKPLNSAWDLKVWQNGNRTACELASTTGYDERSGGTMICDWADTWDGELYLAANGKLCSYTTENGSLIEKKVIADFRNMHFQPIRAPYDDRPDKKHWSAPKEARI